MKTFDQFITELEEDEFHVGSEVKINSPKSPHHGKTGYVNYSSNIPGHSSWSGHDPSSEKHLVMFAKDGKFHKDHKDIFHHSELSHTGGRLAVFETICEDVFTDLEQLNERKFVVRVRAGKRQRRLICDKGQKLHKGRCIQMSSMERQHHRMGSRKATRTKKSEGASLNRRANFKRQKSNRLAKMMGLRKRH